MAASDWWLLEGGRHEDDGGRYNVCRQRTSIV